MKQSEILMDNISFEIEFLALAGIRIYFLPL